MGVLTSTLRILLEDDGLAAKAKADAEALKGLAGSADALKGLAKRNPEVKALAKQLDTLRATAGKIDEFKGASRRLDELGLAHRRARQEVTQTAKALSKAEKQLKFYTDSKDSRPDAYAKWKAEGHVKNAQERVRAAKRANTAAEAAMPGAEAAFKAQGGVVRGLRADLSAAGVAVKGLRAAEAGLASATNQANAALAKQVGLAAKAEHAAARRAERKDVLQTMAQGAGVAVGHKAASIGKHAITSLADYDHAVRSQHVYTDVSEKDQAEILEPQAKRIGQETKFSNEDVVKAQTAAMQGMPTGFNSRLKAEVASGIVENVKYYANLMDVNLQEGSEAIRSYLQATGRDISTKEKALAEANKATNQIVKMAKLGGMNGEDAQQFIKYAAASSTSAGLEPEDMMALGALARRGGLRGDEAGVAMRSMASKIVSPTADGRAALAAAGVNYNDFVKMPERLETDRLQTQFQEKLGKGFTPEIRKKLDAINSNKDLIGDKGKYTEAVVSAVGDILGKDKKGKVRASDAKNAAKAAGKFHQMSAQKTDAMGLLDAAMEKGMTLPQLNAWLTDKHGGKAAITQRQWDEFKTSRAEIKQAGYDQDFAKRKSDYINSGFYGSFQNMKGSIENFYLAVGKANEGLLKFSADLLGNAVDQFSKLPQGAQQVISLGAAAISAAVALRSIYGLTKTLLGYGSGAALTGAGVKLASSAVALDGAAAALTRASLAQAKNGLPGASPGNTVANAAKDTAKSTAASAAGGAAAARAATMGATTVGTVGILGAGALLGVLADAGMSRAMSGPKDGLPKGWGKDLPNAWKNEPGDEDQGFWDKFWNGSRAYQRHAAKMKAQRNNPLGQHVDGDELRRQGEAKGDQATADRASRAMWPDQPTAAPLNSGGAGGAVAGDLAQATAQAASLRSELAAVKAELTALGQVNGLGADGGLLADASGLEAKKAQLTAALDAVQAKVRELGGETISPTITVNGADTASQQLDSVKGKAAEVNGASAAVNVTAPGAAGVISQLQTIISLAGQANNATAGVGSGGGAALRGRSSSSPSFGDGHTDSGH